MTDFVKKAIYIGLGMAGATKEKVEAMADDLAEQARMNEEEGRKFADSLKEEAGKARQDLQSNIRSVVDEALDRVPTLGRVRQLEHRLEAVEKAIGLPPTAAGAEPEGGQDAESPAPSGPECKTEAQNEPRT